MKREARLNTFPVFRVLSEEICERLMKDGDIVRVKYPAETVITSDYVFCVLKGSLKVYSRNNSTQTYLRQLSAGDVFGAAAVFAAQPEISVIKAETEVTLFRISKETIRTLMQSDAAFLDEYLSFLSNRIAFLNSKISCVTAGSAESKLSKWLLENAGADVYKLPVSISDLARLLDIGRASLYRAFDELAVRGCIEKEGSMIRILDRKRLQSDF